MVGANLLVSLYVIDKAEFTCDSEMIASPFLQFFIGQRLVGNFPNNHSFGSFKFNRGITFLKMNRVTQENKGLPKKKISLENKLMNTSLGSPPVLLNTSVGKVSRTLTGTSSLVCLDSKPQIND